MMLPILSRSILHVAVCVAYPLVNNLGFFLYRRFIGAPQARGVDIGLAMWSIFYVFIFVNIVMIAIARPTIKLAIVAFMVAAILLYLLPDFPFRAPGIAIMFGGLSLLAIGLSRPLQRLLEAIAGKKV